MFRCRTCTGGEADTPAVPLPMPHLWVAPAAALRVRLTSWRMKTTCITAVRKGGHPRILPAGIDCTACRFTVSGGDGVSGDGVNGMVAFIKLPGCLVGLQVN